MSAAAAVLAALRGDILAGRLRPGEQVVQEALAVRYGVSRVPLREALRILEGEGLVTHHRNRGTFVAELSVEDLVEVYRIRALLETEAIAAAVPAMTNLEIDRLEAIAVELATATAGGDITAAADANRRLHFAIFQASRMPRLVRVLGQLWDATDAYRALYFADEPNLRRVDDEHEAILGALRSRDAALVARLHDDHRAHAIEALREALRG